MKKLFIALLLLLSSNVLYAQGRGVPSNMKNKIWNAMQEDMRKRQQKQERQHESTVRNAQAAQRSDRQIRETREDAAFLNDYYQPDNYISGPNYDDMSDFSSAHSNTKNSERMSMLENDEITSKVTQLTQKNDGFIINNRNRSLFDEMIEKADSTQERWQKERERRCKINPKECMGHSRPLPNVNVSRKQRVQSTSATSQPTKRNKTNDVPDYKLTKPRRLMEIKKREYVPLRESQPTSSTQQRIELKARFENPDRQNVREEDSQNHAAQNHAATQNNVTDRQVGQHGRETKKMERQNASGSLTTKKAARQETNNVSQSQKSGRMTGDSTASAQSSSQSQQRTQGEQQGPEIVRRIIKSEIPPEQQPRPQSDNLDDLMERWNKMREAMQNGDLTSTNGIEEMIRRISYVK